MYKLKDMAMKFEKEHSGKETLAIGIISIGNRLDPMSVKHAPLLRNLGVQPPGKAIGDYEDFFELTHEGEPLNLNEYACWIADTREDVPLQAQEEEKKG